jgi:hypothetical protein
MSFLDLASVLVERHIELPVQAVLNCVMLPCSIFEVFGPSGIVVGRR